MNSKFKERFTNLIIIRRPLLFPFCHLNICLYGWDNEILTEFHLSKINSNLLKYHSTLKYIIEIWKPKGCLQIKYPSLFWQFTCLLRTVFCHFMSLRTQKTGFNFEAGWLKGTRSEWQEGKNRPKKIWFNFK